MANARMIDAMGRSRRFGIVLIVIHRTAGMSRGTLGYDRASNVSRGAPLTCVKRLLATTRPT